MSLELAGLTKNEEKLYLALLSHTQSGAGALSRKSGLHRRTVYDTLETLIEKGLATYIVENRRKLFMAVNPSILLDKIEQTKENITPVVSGLIQKFLTTKEREHTTFYRGVAGIKTVLRDQLDAKDIVLLGASVNAIKRHEVFFSWFERQRVKKSLHIRVLTTDVNFPKLPLANIRLLAMASSPLTINVYGNVTALIYWSDAPFAIVIKSDDIANAHRAYFDLLWIGAKKLV